MADTFHLKITSPDRVFFEGEVTMVEINTTEGQIGVLPNHIPLTSVLAPGACYLHVPDGDPKVCAIHGGFFEILQDSMTILAEVCEWPDEIDVQRAENARIRAERRLSDKPAGTDIARAVLALKRSAARIEAARK
ncbi:MAG: ATP synthase F1 subunit epsilon [Lachnospiraceae bacterium]|nr:ATP synthase F1 subunit epsilon [Lachnospiraceae bacterium]